MVIGPGDVLLRKWRPGRLRSRAGWLALAGTLALAGCESGPELGTAGYVQGFAGAVVADEPHAALVGRDMLAAGGSAGDAAAATFLALAVTRPAAAGLAAHGYCLDYRVEDQSRQAYRFASPGAVRAIAAIHARLGRLPWRQVVGPAEAMARFGFKRSLAFAADWQAAAPSDPAMQAVFGSGPVGSVVQQFDLAGLLGQIRQQGAGSFYSGGAAQTVWQATESIGVAIDRDGWRATVADAAPVAAQPLGNHSLAYLPFATDGRRGAGSAETAFTVADRQGNAVACVLGMGRPFGIGRLTGGVLLAAAGVPAGEPILVTNPNTKILLAAIAGGDGRAPLERIAQQTVEGGLPLRQALASGGADQVNAIVCPRGLPNYPESCAAVADPAGRGLAAIGEPPR